MFFSRKFTAKDVKPTFSKWLHINEATGSRVDFRSLPMKSAFVDNIPRQRLLRQYQLVVPTTKMFDFKHDVNVMVHVDNAVVIAVDNLCPVDVGEPLAGSERGTIT